MTIDYQPDYTLTGDVSVFEAYMFMTTARFIAGHDAGEFTTGLHIPVLRGTDSDEYAVAVLQQRKDALHNFNVYMTAAVGRFPRAEDLGCFIMYLRAATRREERDDRYADTFAYVLGAARSWCSQENRVLAMVPHLHQGKEMPHIHFLYQRKARERNAFQRFLNDY